MPVCPPTFQILCSASILRFVHIVHLYWFMVCPVRLGMESTMFTAALLCKVLHGPHLLYQNLSHLLGWEGGPGTLSEGRYFVHWGPETISQSLCISSFSFHTTTQTAAVPNSSSTAVQRSLSCTTATTLTNSAPILICDPVVTGVQIRQHHWPRLAMVMQTLSAWPPQRSYNKSLHMKVFSAPVSVRRPDKSVSLNLPYPSDSHSNAFQSQMDHCSLHMKNTDRN
jgi:hypothetical protein